MLPFQAQGIAMYCSSLCLFFQQTPSYKDSSLRGRFGNSFPLPSLYTVHLSPAKLIIICCSQCFLSLFLVCNKWWAPIGHIFKNLSVYFLVFITKLGHREVVLWMNNWVKFSESYFWNLWNRSNNSQFIHVFEIHMIWR